MLPVADGGDGTVAAALSAGFDEVIVEAVGPTGEQVRASYAMDGDRAVVELAAVVGLGMLPDGGLDPLGSSTYGWGWSSPTRSGGARLRSCLAWAVVLPRRRCRHGASSRRAAVERTWSRPATRRWPPGAPGTP